MLLTQSAPAPVTRFEFVRVTARQMVVVTEPVAAGDVPAAVSEALTREVGWLDEQGFWPPGPPLLVLFNGADTVDYVTDAHALLQGPLPERPALVLPPNPAALEARTLIPLLFRHWLRHARAPDDVIDTGDRWSAEPGMIHHGVAQFLAEIRQTNSGDIRELRCPEAVRGEPSTDGAVVSTALSALWAVADHETVLAALQRVSASATSVSAWVDALKHELGREGSAARDAWVLIAGDHGLHRCDEVVSLTPGVRWAGPASGLVIPGAPWVTHATGPRAGPHRFRVDVSERWVDRVAISIQSDRPVALRFKTRRQSGEVQLGGVLRPQARLWFTRDPRFVEFELVSENRDDVHVSDVLVTIEASHWRYRRATGIAAGVLALIGALIFGARRLWVRR